MDKKTTTAPITREAGEGELILGTINPNNPHEIQINPAVLEARQKFLITFAQGTLWNPAAEDSAKKDIFAIGMECGQYGNMTLAEVLEFGRSIGCQVIQPSANHIDLVRAATDAKYRLSIWSTFRRAKMPLTSVSMHVDTFSALAILDNPRAVMFTPADIADQKLGPKGTSVAHFNRLVLMIIGAAQLGIQDLHLFWGMPDDLKPYGWLPQKPADVLAMRQKFAALVKPLIELAKRLGVNLCHEIHFGTIAMTADDLIAVWEMLGKPDNFRAGFDPSHFWHGETWLQAMDKLRKAGMKVGLAHAKNAVIRQGRPMLGLEMDDRLRGMAFASLDDMAGMVSMWEYAGALTISSIVQIWFSRGLPVPVHVEAENPFFRINEVTAKGVKYLRSITDGLQLPQGHFTDAMCVKTPAASVAAETPATPPAAEPAAPTEVDVAKVIALPAQVGDHVAPDEQAPTTPVTNAGAAAVVAEIDAMKQEQRTPGLLPGLETRVRREKEATQPATAPAEQSAEAEPVTGNPTVPALNPDPAPAAVLAEVGDALKGGGLIQSAPAADEPFYPLDRRA